MPRFCLIAFTFLMALVLPGWQSTAQEAEGTDQSGVILIYHRFGEGQYSATNIKIEQFQAQIDHLKANDFTVMALPDMVSAIRAGQSLPSKAIAITIDDAYESVLTKAWPMLKKAGFPASLFVATDPVDQGLGGYLSWDQIRQLRDEGMTIGHHGAAHMHMVDAGIEAAIEDIRRASARFEEELGFIPGIFAYPYGEYSEELMAAVEAEGFSGALAQYSGAAATGIEPFALPRFPLNERYGDLDRFRLVAGTRALPLDGILPVDPVLSDANNPPAFGFSLTRRLPGLAALACYPSHLSEAAPLTVIDDQRVEVRFDKPFPPGRNRINCTMPGPNGRWYWQGRFFYVPGGVLD